ncbi:hypothetical protein [Halorubrum sp. AS12]|uniref:hypothetical protein n=1 Tax=Halorubrum sp. AS12 TaxID=3409687 RepID=UPI003DA78F54
MSFDTLAELDLVVSDRALRNVQQQIESELGAVEIGATDGGAMSAQTGGNSRGFENQTAELEVATAQLNSLETLAAGRNDLLSTIANTDLLDSAPSGIPSGGGGSTEDGDSSTGGETERSQQNSISKEGRHALKLLRAQTEHLDDAVVFLEDIEDAVSEGGLGGGGGGMLTEVLGVAGETAGDVAVEGGGTVADAISDVLTGTAASALGNTISSAITGSEVAVEETTLSVEPPGWIDEIGGGRTVRFSPTFEPTFEAPDLGPEINIPDLPDLNLGIPDQLAVNREPLPVQRDPLPVEAIDPLPVEDVGPITVAVETLLGRPPASTGSGSDAEPPGGIQFGGDNGFTFGPDGIQVGDDDGLTLGRDPGDPTGTQSGSDGSTSTPAPSREVTVTHSPTYNVDVDPRRLGSLADRIVSEVEDGVERDIDALENDLHELERELEDLEREITR